MTYEPEEDLGYLCDLAYQQALDVLGALTGAPMPVLFRIRNLDLLS